MKPLSTVLWGKFKDVDRDCEVSESNVSSDLKAAAFAAETADELKEAVQGVLSAKLEYCNKKENWNNRFGRLIKRLKTRVNNMENHAEA